MTRHIRNALLFIAVTAPLLYAEEPPKTEEQKTLYAIGLTVSRQLAVFNLTPKELAIVQQGILDGSTNKKIDVDLAVYNGKIQQLAKFRRNVEGEKQAVAGRDFLEKAAREKGAVKTASGLVYFSTAEGKGESPKATDSVTVNYRGTLPDGREFDSSYKRGKPLEFKLNNVIKCWTEGVQKMKPGGKARLVCPANLAYGDAGTGEMILPGATLNFEVELIEVKKPVLPPKPAVISESVKPALPETKK